MVCNWQLPLVGCKIVKHDFEVLSGASNRLGYFQVHMGDIIGPIVLTSLGKLIQISGMLKNTAFVGVEAKHSAAGVDYIKFNFLKFSKPPNVQFKTKRKASYQNLLTTRRRFGVVDPSMCGTCGGEFIGIMIEVSNWNRRHKNKSRHLAEAGGLKNIRNNSRRISF